MDKKVNRLPPSSGANNHWTAHVPTQNGVNPQGRLPQGRLPRISVVTPSYNTGQYLERTIRSVLLQQYPSLEYVVIDGGSQDGSIDIIEKYQPWLKYWISEKDQGQTSAINKGLRICTGEFVAYLNADDTYLPNTLFRVAEHFEKNPNCDLLYGNSVVVDQDDHVLCQIESKPFNLLDLLCLNYISQPTVFFRRRLLDEVGYFNENLHFAMDLDYWYRSAGRFNFCYLPETLAAFRMTDSNKSAGSFLPFFLEREQSLDDFFMESGNYLSDPHKAEIMSCHYHYGGRVFLRDGERAVALRSFLRSLHHQPIALRSLRSFLGAFDCILSSHFLEKSDQLVSKFRRLTKAKRS